MQNSDIPIAFKWKYFYQPDEDFLRERASITDSLRRFKYNVHSLEKGGGGGSLSCFTHEFMGYGSCFCSKKLHLSGNIFYQPDEDFLRERASITASLHGFKHNLHSLDEITKAGARDRHPVSPTNSCATYPVT